MAPGAYLGGGHLAMAPRIVYLAENSKQNCGMPPFVTWAQGFSTQTVGEDLFFGLHLLLGQIAN